MTTSRAALAIAGLLLLAGCGGDTDGSGSGDAPSPSPASTGRLDWGAPFPFPEVTDLDGNAVSIPVDGGWTGVALSSGACAVCQTQLPEYDAKSIVWRDMGLTFGVLSERDPGLLRATVVEDRLQLPMWHTTTSLFPVTRILNEPVLALVDPSGIVRFIGRRDGTVDERLVSIRRNYYHLGAPDSVRVALAQRSLPEADRVEIVNTLDTDWLGVAACQLGLSPWFGRGHAADGSPAGYAFPIERDTNCDSCESLYLVIGFDSRRRISALAEIEPVISLGRPQYTRALFPRYIGLRAPEQISTVPERLVQSPRADEVIRELVTVAFALAERIPQDGGD